MDLETLQVVFDMNTELIQPKLDALKEKFNKTLGGLGQTVQEESNNATNSIDLSGLTEKFSESFTKMQDQTAGFFEKFEKSMNQGSESGTDSITKNMHKMRVSVGKDVDSMVSDINAKMEQAKAAQERMANLKSLGGLAADRGDYKTSTRTNEQAASEQAKMVRSLNAAKDLARSMKDEYKEIPAELQKIAQQMDHNEAEIGSYQRKIKELQAQQKDAMKFESGKGFGAKQNVQTDDSRKIGEEIEKVQKKVSKAINSSDSLNKAYAKLQDRYGELGKAIPKVNTDLSESATVAKRSREAFSLLDGSTSKTKTALKGVATAIGKLSGISYMLKRGSSGMNDMGHKARSLSSTMASLGSRSNSSLNKMNKGIKKSDSQLSELARGIKSLPAQFLVWGVGFEALTKLSEGFANAFKTNKQFSNSLNQIKANLIAAFYPLYSTVMPWINQFMQVLEKATGWLAKFSASLFGMSDATARAGANKMYTQAKALGDDSGSSSASNEAAKKAVQAENAAIRARNDAGRKAVQEENAQIKARNSARKKAIQEQNAAIKAANEQRKKAVEQANDAIRASNKRADDEVAEYNKKQKERIDELKKKYQDYKNNLMGFDEINTLDVSKEIPDYTPKEAHHQDLEEYTPKDTISDSGEDEALKTFTPEETKSLSDALDDAAKDLDGIQQALGNVSPAFGGASDAAKKFRDILADLYRPIKEAWDAKGKVVLDAMKYAFNEIKRLIGDIGKSFLKIWDSKLGVQTLEDLLQLFANIINILGDVAKAFADAWEDHGTGDKYIKSIFVMLDSILKLLGSITESFRKAWNDGTGERIAQNLLKLFTDINNTIADFADSFRKAWNEGDAGTKLFETWLNDIGKLLRDLDDIVISFKKAWDAGDIGRKIFSDIIDIAKQIGKLIGTFADSFHDAWNQGETGTKMFGSWLDAIKKVLDVIDDFVSSFTAAWKEGAVGTGIFKDIFKISGSVGKTIGNLAGQFKKAWDAGKTGQSILHTILEIFKDIFDHLSDMADATAKWAKKLDFTPLLKSIEGLFKSIKGLDKTVWDAIEWAYKNVLLPLAKFTITDALPTFFKLLSSAIKVVNSVLKALAPLGKSLIDAFLKPIAGFTGGSSISALKGIADALEGLSSWIDKHQKAVQTFAKVLATMFVIKTSFKGLSKGTSLVEDLLTKSKGLDGKKGVLKEFFGKITGISDLKDGVENVKDLWGYSRDLASVSWGKLKDGASTAKGLASTSWTKLKDGASVAGDLVSVKWSSLKSAAGNVVNLVKGFKDWSIWSKAAAAGQVILDAAMDANPIGLIATAIAAVVAGLVVLYTHNKKFRDFVNGIYTNITKWMGDAIKWLKNNWQNVAKFIINPVGSIADWFLKDTKLGKNVSKWAGNALDWLKKNWKDVALLIINPVAGITNWFLKDTKTGQAILKWGKKALDNAVSWAKDIGKNIGKKVESGKKAAQDAGSKVGKWVSDKVKDASTTIKKWSKNLGKDINDAAKSAKSLASKAGKTVGGWVHTGVTTADSKIKSWSKDLGSLINKASSGAKTLASKTGKTIGGWVHTGVTTVNSKVKSWSKGLGSLIHTASSGAKSLASKAGSSVGGWVHSGIKGINSKIQTWSKGLGSYIGSHISSGKSAASKAGQTVGGWVHSGITSVSKKITGWAGSLGGKIASGLKNGVDAIKRASADIANGILSTIGKAVNGVIKGIKWILDKVGAHGMADGMSYWDVPHFAQGGHHQGGLAMVNDENASHYREAYQLPNGKQGIFPAQRNMMVYLPKGTRIKNAQQTYREATAKLPHYANGLFGNFDFSMPNFGDILGGLGSGFSNAIGGAVESVEDRIKDIINGIRGIAGNISYDASHPMEVIKKGVGQFVNLGYGSDLGTAVAKGGVSSLEDGAVNMVHKALKEAFDKAKEKARKIAEAAYSAAKKATDATSKAAGSLFDGKNSGFNILDSLKGLHLGFKNGGFVNQAGTYNLAEENTPEIVLPLSQPSRALELMQQAMGYMKQNFGDGITMPHSMVTSSTIAPSDIQSNPQDSDALLHSNGTAGLQEALMSAISVAMANQQMDHQTNQGSQQPIEITVKLGDETLGKHAVNGINSFNRKNGRQMLDL
ncbi:hypothetical protein [Levilactobacillus bambusae]|uniref:Tape measure protein n=1 Tax=Levilactobacillus bambusae TaxID=2024736 RepID=A0A2V1N1S9_9LACO|nr:hypothetical protein [Levilactobacillus bambusae]PWG00953.1 hypothetical protein DCM90_01895 [Levilactobacillus bambusae]